MILFHGFALTFLAGVSVGFCLWSLKWARNWKWENFWLVYTIASMIIVPFAIAFCFLPHLGRVYSSLTPSEILVPFVLGASWGFCQLGAGVSTHKLGIAVSSAVLNGVGTAFGTVLPLILLHRALMLQTSGRLIFAGTAVMLVGAGLCGWSGYHREEEAKQQGRGSGFSTEQSAMNQDSLTRRQYVLLVAMTVGAGVLASLLNVALAYGGSIMQKACAQGAQASWAPFAVWPIALLGGSIVNIGYCIYLLTTNHTWGNFVHGAKEVFNPLLAACLWMGGIALYSSGTSYLGVLGVSIGFGLYMIVNIVSGQFAAIATGEWHLMRASIYRSFAAGIACLVLAVVTIGASNYVSK
jgi:L-rhamnose-H+ transport protein